MGGIPTTLAYLLITWGAITAVLVALVIYGNTLSIRENEEIYLNQEEEKMMATLLLIPVPIPGQRFSDWLN